MEATPGRDTPLTVSYSDYGHHDPNGPSHDNVVLICGPMLSCRLVHAAKDAIAKRHGLRIIHPDRMGMGHTTKVPIDQRIETWLRSSPPTSSKYSPISVTDRATPEIVPALLAHLQIPHVSVVCQSGGAIYAVSILLHLRHLLHPQRPYLAMGAPWIDPSHTGAPAMVLTSAAVPSAVLGKLQSLNSAVQAVAPVSAFSSMCLKAFVPGWATKQPLADGVDRAEVEFAEKLAPLVIKRAYEEEMSGLGEEALFFMRRKGKWGDWGDYDTLLDMVAARGDAAGAKVKVRAYFAESDIMIGAGKGPAWFDKCWTERAAGQIDYRSKRVPHADHDSILDIRFGVIEEIFKDISLLAEEAES